MPEKIFTTWKFNDVRYISFDNGNGGFTVIDEYGGNYGSWQDVDHLRKRQQSGELIGDIGFCRLTIWSI